jgi:hypothetical protein
VNGGERGHHRRIRFDIFVLFFYLDRIERNDENEEQGERIL